MNQLPDNIATADQLNEIQQEHTQRLQKVYKEMAAGKAGLEKAISAVEQRCEKTEQALQELAAQKASSEEVENLREAHTQSIQNLLDRIEHESSERQHDLEDLERRWVHLRENMDQLAESATPKSTFKAVNRSLTSSVQALGQQVGQISHKQQNDLQNLVEKLQESEKRLTALENREQVMVNINPEGGRELAELLEAVRQERARLHEDLSKADQSAAELNQSSERVNQLLNQWDERAGQVQAQTTQLRESAKKAGGIFQALQKCNQAIDAKLKSPKWREELKQGEQLASRLERVTHEARSAGHQLQEALQHFEECRNQAGEWQERHQQANKISKQLAKLVTMAEDSSQKLENSMANRNRLIEAIAKNSAHLAEVIQSAQQEDVSNSSVHASSPGRDRKSGHKEVRRIEWPAYAGVER
jgi:chromosome segregation ATPase